MKASYCLLGTGPRLVIYFAPHNYAMFWLEELISPTTYAILRYYGTSKTWVNIYNKLIYRLKGRRRRQYAKGQ